MNKVEHDRWQAEVLKYMLEAFAAHGPLRCSLIFKGARILNLRLDSIDRESFDLDSNIDFHCAVSHPQDEDRRAFFNRETDLALRKYFSHQDPVLFRVQSVITKMKPQNGNHPFGWTGFTLTIHLSDDKRKGVRGLPPVKLEIAAYEKVGELAISDLCLSNGLVVQAQTLERIAREKMRAFLTSLPAYFAKIGCHQVGMRVKDLYDLARIRRRFEIADNAFWRTAGREFQRACESRFVDCAGIETFAENLDKTRYEYENASTLPKDIPFDEAWTTVQAAVDLFTGLGILPFAFALP